MLDVIRTGKFKKEFALAEKAVDKAVYLHYYTDTADYFISRGKKVTPKKGD